jgi:hypothetical protein
MKNYLVKILLLCFSLSAHSTESVKLSELRLLQWKNRIILVNNLHNQQGVLALFEKNKSEIKERDIIWFVFNADKAETNYQGALSEDFIAKTRDRYQIGPGKIMLIGKDGGVKFLLDRMDLEAIFTEIDAMPMRQNEMVH